MDWKAYYDARVPGFDPHDHLAQVGHTVNGQPIPEDHFQALLNQISDILDPAPSDRLLDVCCGNGLFTKPLAMKVQMACGVDISEAMLAVAQADYAAPNLHYLQMDACDVATLAQRPEAPFTHVLLYGAWQHFTLGTGRDVLEALLKITTPDVKILLGFVPDQALMDNFFDTPERRAAHAAYVAAGTDSFGTWWDRDVLSKLCADLGLSCQYTDLPPQVHAASYRFNAQLARI
ncbi:class I SAM-dependent methyltransferase [Primorskyibacter sp. 2E233]|uniref:class I SAM-dependent methyltransferase n=1 Tax=Primorskyibacter sp. 2E233 TaxID=3413431 RepID=UPI003BEF7B7F